MKNKAIAGTAFALLLTVGTIAFAGDQVGPLGSLKLDKKTSAAPAGGAVTPPAAPATTRAVPGISKSAVVAQPEQAPKTTPVPVATAQPVAKQPAPVAKAPTQGTSPAPKPVAAAQPRAATPSAIVPPVSQAAKRPPAVASAAPVTAAAAASVAPTPAAEPLPAPEPPVSVPSTLHDEPSIAARRIRPVKLSDREIAYQEQQADLARQIRIRQMQVELRELDKKLSEAEAPSADSVVLPPMPPVSSVLDVPEEPVVRLISVWGDPAKLTADVLAKGVRTSVKAGDPLPDGWRVVEVGRNSLLIQRGRTKSVVKIGG